MFCKIRFKGDDERKVEWIRLMAALGRLYLVRSGKKPVRIKYIYGMMHNGLGRRMTESEMLYHNHNGRLRLLTWEAVE